MVAEVKTVRYSDLREWLDLVEAFQELRLVRGADWNLEIGALTELMPRRSDTPPPSCSTRSGLPARIPPAHQLPDQPEAPGADLRATQGPPRRGPRRRLAAAAAHAADTPPRVVERGPVQQNVLTGADVDLTRFPAPLWHEDDGGRYLGHGYIAITRDPDSGWVNAGTPA